MSTNPSSTDPPVIHVAPGMTASSYPATTQQQQQQQQQQTQPQLVVPSSSVQPVPTQTQTHHHHQQVVSIPNPNPTPLMSSTTGAPPKDASLTSRNPMGMHQCPHCHVVGSRTRVKTYPNWLTWTSAAGLFIVFWPVCWVPLVVDNMKQTDHYCVNCGKCVGSVQPFQDCCVTRRG